MYCKDIQGVGFDLGRYFIISLWPFNSVFSVSGDLFLVVWICPFHRLLPSFTHSL